MRHTRNRQLNKAYQTNEFTKDGNYRFDEYIHSSIDKSFKWHSEAVSSNFWSNFRKSCVSFNYKSSHPNAIGMATKYLPTKEKK